MKRTGGMRTGLGALGTAVFLAALIPAAEAATPSASAERIVYTGIGRIPPQGTESPQGAFPADIYALAADGTTANLTAANPYSDMHPAVSSDGTRVAWSKVTGVDSPLSNDIWVMGADGSTSVRLTLDGETSTEEQPSFSPDSTWLAFNRRFVDGSAPGPFGPPVQPWAVRADGTQVRLAEQLPGATTPVISPDGSKVALYLNRDLWIADLDGSNAVNLTGPLFPDDDHNEAEAEFSPDGKSLVFSGRLPAGGDAEFGIFRVDLDGGGLVHLTSGEGFGGSPTVSPDGSHIAFAAPAGNGVNDLWVLKADGTGLVNVTNTPDFFEGWPDWGHLVVPPPADGPPEDCVDPVPTVPGTDTADALPGTRGGDVIAGEAGNDRLVGGAGRDVLCAGDAVSVDADQLDGGGSKDFLDGGRGADVLRGGPGDDLLSGGPGEDSCKGGPGKDRTRSC